jgi:hypothetical protein
MNAQKYYASIWEQKWTERHITKLENCTHKSLSEGKDLYATIARIPRRPEDWHWLEQYAISVRIYCSSMLWWYDCKVHYYYLTAEYSPNANSATNNVWDSYLANRICVSCKSGWNYSNEIPDCGTCKPFKLDRQTFVADMILPTIIAFIHEQTQRDLQQMQSKPTNIEQIFFDCFLVKNIIDRIRM